MNKQHMLITKQENIEVYCTRPAFGYNCSNTPHNCTECPIMRFHYYDLINRILDEESAKQLSTMVEESGIFSGKYDNVKKGLPDEIWSIIYAIRKAYYDCSIYVDPNTEGYHSGDELRQRFSQWFSVHGTYQGLPIGEAIVKIALNDIKPGVWLAMDRDRSDDYPLIMEESGVLKPAVFNDAADGIEYLSEIIREKVCSDFAKDHVSDCYIGISSQNYPGDAFRIITVRGIPNYMNLIYAHTTKEKQIDTLLNVQKVAYKLLRLDKEWISNYRARYLERVKEIYPSIAFSLRIK